MFGIAARRMGYRVHTFEPAPDSPAGQVSDREFNGSYTDKCLLDEFVASVDVVTFEFETIPAEVVNRISQSKPVHPRAEVLHICQNREREKTFLRRYRYPLTPFAIVSNQEEFDAAIEQVGTPGSAQALALEVPDLDVFRTALSGRGIEASEPHDLTNCRISVVRDPDGNQIWLHQSKPH